MAPVLRAALPAALLVLATLLWSGFYNYRVTGNPLRTPYQAHSAAYVQIPLLRFGSLEKPPHYNHEIFRKHYGVEDLNWYRNQYTLAGQEKRIRTLWVFYLGVAGTIALLGLPMALRDPWIRMALVPVLLTVGTTLFVTTWGGFPHYIAPVAGLLVALQVAGLEAWWAWRPKGRHLGVLVVAAFWIALAVGLAGRVREHRLPEKHWSFRRARLIRALRAQPGRDLVLVRYGKWHPPSFDWVYNSADLKSQPVIFARAMNDALDRQLIDAFPDRRVWLLEEDWPPRGFALKGDPLAPPERRGRIPSAGWLDAILQPGRAVHKRRKR